MRRTCLERVYDLAREDERVVFIGSDLGPGTLDEFRRDIPERFFMEGVSEAHLAGMAAGMAMEGLIPYINTIATFLTRRCYEQIAIDLCLHNLPVRLIGNGGGLVYAPLGPTHIAIDDIALMRTLPNMTVVAPADADEMSRFMAATPAWPGPIYIRLGKGGDAIVSREEDGFAIGKAILMRDPGRVLIVASGVMVGRALAAADMLAGAGIDCGVLNLHTIKPIDTDALVRLANEVRLVVTVDEHLVSGGLGSAVLETLSDQGGPLPAIIRLGIPDRFTQGYGSQDTMMERLALQPHQIADKVLAAHADGRVQRTGR